MAYYSDIKKSKKYWIKKYRLGVILMVILSFSLYGVLHVDLTPVQQIFNPYSISANEQGYYHMISQHCFERSVTNHDAVCYGNTPDTEMHQNCLVEQKRFGSDEKSAEETCNMLNPIRTPEQIEKDAENMANAQAVFDKFKNRFANQPDTGCSDGYIEASTDGNGYSCFSIDEFINGYSGKQLSSLDKDGCLVGDVKLVTNDKSVKCFTPIHQIVINADKESFSGSGEYYAFLSNAHRHGYIFNGDKIN